MKLLILAVFVVFAANVSALPPLPPLPALPPPPPKEVIAQVIGTCAEKTEATPEIIEKIRAHDLSFEDAKGKCFEKCMCTNLGMCGDDLKLLKEKFIGHPKVPLPKVEEFLPACNELKGDNECETVHLRFKCIFDKVPEIPLHKALGPPQ